MKYSAILSKPQWQKKRLECFESAGWKCQRCGNDKRFLHLHHPIYSKEWKNPWEYENLEVICSKCHIKEHESDSVKMVVGKCYTIKTGTNAGAVGIAEQEDWEQKCHMLHFYNHKTKEWGLSSFFGSEHKLRKASSSEEAKFRKAWMENEWLN